MKTLIIVVTLALSCLYAQAQEKSIRLGAKVGANFSLFTKSVAPFDQRSGTRFEYFDRDARISGMAGLTAEFVLTNRFSMGAEFLFSSRGMAYDEENNYAVILNDEGENTASNRYTYSINYLEIPVTINYNFQDASSNFRLVGYAGIAPAMAIHSKTQLKFAKGIDGDGYRALNEHAELKNVRLFNNNLLLGLQVGENSTKRLGGYLDLRGSYTLRSVFNRQVQRNTNMDTKLLTFTVAVGIRI